MNEMVPSPYAGSLTSPTELLEPSRTSVYLEPVDAFSFPEPAELARLEAQRPRFTASSKGTIPQGMRTSESRLAASTLSGEGGPASRERNVSQPRRTDVRLGHVSLDARSVSGYYDRDYSDFDNFSMRGEQTLGSTIAELHTPVFDVDSIINDDGDRNLLPSSPRSSSPASRPLKNSYVSSARVHAHPAAQDRRVRASGLLAANRLTRMYTKDAEAQVPPQCRGNGCTATGGKPTLVPPSVVLHGPSPLTPVRGSVVLASLRCAPRPPTNAVRTKASGEFIYDGPSHLVRERASALFEAEASRESPGADVASRGSEDGGGALALTESWASSPGRRASGGDTDWGRNGGSVTSLQFESKLGQPRLAPFAQVDAIYHHGSQSIASLELAARKSAKKKSRPQSKNPPFSPSTRPRFPIQ